MKTYQFLIEQDLQERIDKYLVTQLPEFTRNGIQILITSGDVLVNNEVIKPSYKLRIHDDIEVNISEPEMDDIIPQDIPLEVVYEDSDLIVVNKVSGMVVHPAAGNKDRTLVNALLFHCKDLSGINGVMRAGIVHRIDKDTSGLLVACKNDFAHQNLSEQFAAKKVTRKYQAIVYGEIPHNLGKIEAPIGRSTDNRQQMAVVEKGKYAVTHFHVLERFKGFTFIELELETGRTHQIRVHMKYIGFPVVGDPVYGPRNIIGEYGQYLHAKTLGFLHPRKNIFMEFDSKLPGFFEELLETLRKEQEYL